MKIGELKYKETLEYLNRKQPLFEELKSIVNQLFSKKEMRFSLEDETKYPELINKNILVKNKINSHFLLNFKSVLVCAVLLDYAEVLLKTSLPKDPKDAIEFKNQFLIEITKPNTNLKWYYNDLEVNLTTFILLELESHFNLRELKIIYNQNDASDFKNHLLKIDLLKAIPLLKMEIINLIELCDCIVQDKKLATYGYEILRDFGLLTFENAEEIYKIIYKNHKYSNFLPIAIIAISKFKFNRAFKLANSLTENTETVISGISCLRRLNFVNNSQAHKIYNIIKEQNISPDSCREIVIAKYTFIDSSVVSKTLKEEILKDFINLLYHNNEQIVSEALYWLSNIKAFEEERCIPLKELLLKNIGINFWEYFKNFNDSKYIFKTIMDYYWVHKLSASIEGFTMILNKFKSENRQDFDYQVLLLLSNNISIYRKAGVDIIINLGLKYSSFNLSNISKSKQIIALDTLLEFPIMIEETFPYALQFRKSEFKYVKERLLTLCKKSVDGFGLNSIIIMKEVLDITIEFESEFLSKIEDYWKQLKTLINQKEKLEELNPFTNQRSLIDLYYRIEEESKAIQMEHAISSSSMIKLGVANRSQILRGSGFKMEKGSGGISMLGKIEKGISINKRYYSNPTLYNYEYKQHFLSNDHITEEE